MTSNLEWIQGTWNTMKTSFQFKQHFAIIFRRLTKRTMVLVYWNFFLAYLTMLAPLKIDWTTSLIIKDITLSHKAMWIITLHQYILIFPTYLCAIDFQWPLQSYLFYVIAVYCIIMVLFCCCFVVLVFALLQTTKWVKEIH